MTMLAGLLARALGDVWAELSEEIGLWIPVQIINTEHDDKPEGEEELGNDIVNCSVQILSRFFVMVQINHSASHYLPVLREKRILLQVVLLLLLYH